MQPQYLRLGLEHVQKTYQNLNPEPAIPDVFLTFAVYAVKERGRKLEDGYE